MIKFRCACGHAFSDGEAMRLHREGDRAEHDFHSWRSYQLADVERSGMLPDRDTPESKQFHESLYRMLDREGELWECPGCGRLHFRQPGEQDFRSFRPDA